MVNRFDRVVNIAVLITCTALLCRLGVDAFNIHKTSDLRGFKEGSIVVGTRNLRFSAASRTLIIATSSHCRYCQQSMPFFRRLTDKAQSSGVRVLAVALEDTSTNRSFLLQNGLHVDDVAAVSEIKVDIRATPTLILVNSRGAVVASWVGAIAPDKEGAVESALNSRG